MTPQSDAASWLLVLNLVAAGIATLPYRKTAAMRAEYLDSLDQSVHLGGQGRHLAERPLPASVNEQQENGCGESPDQLHEGLAGTPLAHAPHSVLTMSRDTAENAEQPAQGLLTAASRTTGKAQRHDTPASHQDMVDNTADCGCRLSPHSGPYRTVPYGSDLERVDADTHRTDLTDSWCTGTLRTLAAQRKGVGCGP